MTTPNLLMAVPLVAGLLLAAVIDNASRRIPNWLSLPLLAAGILQSFFASSVVSPASSLLGALSALGLMIPFFLIGARGGGDVKILTAIGAWVGPQAVLAIFVIESILGLVYALGLSAANGRLRMLFRNSAVVAINLAHIREVGVDHALDAEKRYRVGDRPLPYAVPALVATVLILGLKWRGGIL